MVGAKIQSWDLGLGKHSQWKYGRRSCWAHRNGMEVASRSILAKKREMKQTGPSQAFMWLRSTCCNINAAVRRHC